MKNTIVGIIIGLSLATAGAWATDWMERDAARAERDAAQQERFQQRFERMDQQLHRDWKGSKPC
jgi:hypothetical protein